MTEHAEQVMSGHCLCGCGQRTHVPTRNDAQKGWVKGRPLAYVRGHHHAKRRYVGNRGYIMVHQPDHPNAGKSGHVGEHVLIASGALGRPLPPGAEVHHLNGDRADNRPGNLILCHDHAYHMLLHRRQRALAESGHADWVSCVRCKSWGPEGSMLPHGGGGFVHTECRAAYRRAWGKKAKEGRS